MIKREIPDYAIEDMPQLIKSGKFTEAEQSLKIIVRQERKNAEAWFFLGTVYLFTKYYDKAKGPLELASKLDSKLEGVWKNLGAVYKILGDKPKALKAYKKASKINPKDATIWLALSEIHNSMHKTKEATKCMKKAQALDPQLVDSIEELKQEYAQRWTKPDSNNTDSKNPKNFLKPVDLIVNDFDSPWMLRFDDRVRLRMPYDDLEKELKIPFKEISPLLEDIAQHCLMYKCEASMHAIRNYTGLDAFSVGSLYAVIGNLKGYYFTLRSDYSRGHDEMLTFHKGKNPMKRLKLF